MDIIEAFAVSMGFDTSTYERGSKRIRQEDDATRDQFARSSKEIERGNARVATGLRSVRNEVLGLFLTFAGASSLKGFVEDLLTGAAATDRFSKNIGVARNDVYALQNAVKTIGGSASDANGSLQSLASMYQNFQLRGDYSKAFDLAGLGLTYQDLANPIGALSKLAAASERMSKPEFANRASALGIDQNTINLLEQGRKGFEQLMEAERRKASITDQDAKSAERLQKAMADLGTAIKGQVLPYITPLVEDFAEFLEKGDGLTVAQPLIVGALVAIGIAAAGAIGPVGLLAGAMATLIAVATQADITRRLPDALSILKLKAQAGIAEFQAQSAMRAGDKDGAIAAQRKALGYRQQISDLYAKWDSPSANSPLANMFSTYLATGNMPSFGGAGGSVVPAGASGANTDIIQSFLTANGISAEQARGITAGIVAESRGDPNIVNSSSGAYGIGQWLGPRKRALFAKYGPHPTLQQQLEFLLSELRGGDRGGAAVLGASGADATLSAYVNSFMRPGPGAAGDMARGRAWLGRGPLAGRSGGAVSQSTTIGQITINNPTPNDAAPTIRSEFAKRGLVVQSNTGVEH